MSSSSISAMWPSMSSAKTAEASELVLQESIYLFICCFICIRHIITRKKSSGSLTRLILDYMYHWATCTIGLQVPLGNMYHWATSTIGLQVPLGNMYHWATCTIGLHVPLGYRYHWVTCTTGLHVPLGYRYHWATCTIGLHVPLGYVYH